MSAITHGVLALLPEVLMWPCLVLAASLAFGQTEAPPAEKPSSPPAPLPDRWLLMKSLQGTWPGAVLDQNRMQVSGWTDVSLTASSAEHTNLPLGFNHRANELLLQQNWLRF